MALRIHYGNHKIEVDPKTDVEELRGGLRMAFDGDGWLGVPVETGEQWLFISPGVPIRIETYDDSVSVVY